MNEYAVLTNVKKCGIICKRKEDIGRQTMDFQRPTYDQEALRSGEGLFVFDILFYAENPESNSVIDIITLATSYLS